MNKREKVYRCANTQKKKSTVAVSKSELNFLNFVSAILILSYCRTQQLGQRTVMKIGLKLRS